MQNDLAKLIDRLRRDAEELSRPGALAQGIREAPEWLEGKLTAIAETALAFDTAAREAIVAASGHRLRQAREAAALAAKKVIEEERRAVPHLERGRADERARQARARVEETRQILERERSAIADERRTMIAAAKGES